MKTKALVLALLLLVASLAFAQQSGQTTPPASGAQATKPRSAMTPEQRAARRKQMQEQMQQHLQAMKEQVDKAQATLQQMKDNLPKITDPAAQQQAQLDIQMWQTLVDHMAMMMEHMGPGRMGGPGMMGGGMGGPGMMGGGHMHGGMGAGMAGCPCCAQMGQGGMGAGGMKGGGCCGGMAQGDMKGGCCGGAGGMKCGAPSAPKSGGMDEKK